jgi:hypothetical protein
MINMEKACLIFTFILMAIFCFGQDIDKPKLETSKRLIALIKASDYDKVLKMFPDEIAANIPREVLKQYIDMGADFIEKYGIPNDDDLITKVKFVPTKDGEIKIYSITFPFPAGEKYSIPARVIEVGFIPKYGDEKIVNLNITELTPMQSVNAVEAGFLDKLDFNTKSITDWRLYYEKGETKNNNKEVFAVSGDKAKLESLQLESQIQSMFNNLSAAPITEKKIQNDITRYNGKPENISLRWQYKGDSQFYRISIILNEETGIIEPLSKYAEISISEFANEQTIYLILKKDIAPLVKIMTEFAYKDWGKNYEANP